MIADDLARLGQVISSYIIEADQNTGVDLKGHYNNNRGYNVHGNHVCYQSRMNLICEINALLFAQ